MPEDYHEDLIKRVAITSSIYRTDTDTHIETVTYGDGGDSMRILYTLIVGDGTAEQAAEAARPRSLMHPGRLAKILFPKHWSRRTIIILVMRSLDNAIAGPTHRPVGTFWLADRTGPRASNPTFIPVAKKAANGSPNEPAASPRGSVMEATFNIPEHRSHPRRRRHRLGPRRGRHRSGQRVFGYENLSWCDGSASPRTWA